MGGTITIPLCVAMQIYLRQDIEMVEQRYLEKKVRFRPEDMFDVLVLDEEDEQDPSTLESWIYIILGCDRRLHLE